MVEDAISFWTDIQRYEDMLAKDPGSYCFAPLSELYRKLGLLDDAISVAQKGCALHPDYPGGFFALGSAYYDKGQKAEARQALEQVVSLKPDHLLALRLLGQVCVETGEMELARKALGWILEQDPDDTESALLLRSIGSSASTQRPGEEVLEEADLIEDLTEVLDEEPALEPKSGLAEVAQALAEYEWGAAPAAPRKKSTPDYDSEEFWAIEDVEEPEEGEEQGAGWGEPAAAAASGRDPLTTATLAELYVSQGFTEKAAAVYRELLSSDPANRTYRDRYQQLMAQAEQAAAQAAPEAPPQHPKGEAPPQLPAEAPPQRSAAETGAEPPQSELEAQLTGWLENIRRRRDGV